MAITEESLITTMDDLVDIQLKVEKELYNNEVIQAANQEANLEQVIELLAEMYQRVGEVSFNFGEDHEQCI